MVCEEVVRNEMAETQDFKYFINLLEEKSLKSKTSKLWLDCLIKPVLIMMMFVRAEREGDWALHLHAVSNMLP